MKNKKTELEIDFIGGGRKLTSEDEKFISEFIKANKLKGKRKAARKRNSSRKKTLS